MITYEFRDVAAGGREMKHAHGTSLRFASGPSVISLECTGQKTGAQYRLPLRRGDRYRLPDGDHFDSFSLINNWDHAIDAGVQVGLGDLQTLNPEPERAVRTYEFTASPALCYSTSGMLGVSLANPSYSGVMAEIRYLHVDQRDTTLSYSVVIEQNNWTDPGDGEDDKWPVGAQGGLTILHGPYTAREVGYWDNSIEAACQWNGAINSFSWPYISNDTPSPAYPHIIQSGKGVGVYKARIESPILVPPQYSLLIVCSRTNHEHVRTYVNWTEREIS